MRGRLDLLCCLHFRQTVICERKKSVLDLFNRQLKGLLCVPEPGDKWRIGGFNNPKTTRHPKIAADMTRQSSFSSWTSFCQIWQHQNIKKSWQEAWGFYCPIIKLEVSLWCFNFRYIFLSNWKFLCKKCFLSWFFDFACLTQIFLCKKYYF